MPRTSASCRLNPEPRAPRGFTLLELLVVLALVALLTGLVAPGVVRGVAAAKERGATADVQALLEQLPVEAFRDGSEQLLGSGELNARIVRRTDWPDGWRLKVEPPLRYGATGVASGGSVQLLIANRTAAAWAVAPVSGTVARVNAGLLQ